MSGPALALPAAAATLAWASLRLLVARLPEPAQVPDAEADGWMKPPYRTLAGRGAQTVALLAGGAAGVVCTQQPTSHTPLLLALAGPVTALAITDHRTTYLPLWLTRFCAGVAAVGAVATTLLSPTPAVTAAHLLAGAAAAGCLFWLLLRLGGGLGYGDVRLAPLLGAGAVLDGWPGWWTCFLTGTALGAVAGLATATWRRRHPHPLGSVFPYGPSLVLGLWAGLLVT